jgi:hypothetical protein
MQGHHSTAVVIIPPAGQSIGHILHLDPVIANQSTGERYHDSERISSLLGDFIARKLACERRLTSAGEGQHDSTPSSLEYSPPMVTFKTVIVKDLPAQPLSSNACGPATQLIIKRLAERSDLEGLQDLSQSMAGGGGGSVVGPLGDGSLLQLCGLSDIAPSHYEENRKVVRKAYMEFMSRNEALKV